MEPMHRPSHNRKQKLNLQETEEYIFKLSDCSSESSDSNNDSIEIQSDHDVIEGELKLF